MANKNTIQYLILLILIVLCVMGIMNLRRNTNQLNEPQKIMEQVLKEMAESKKIIENQSATIDDLKKLNHELLLKVHSIDSMNKVLKKNIDASLSSANKSILEIKKNVDEIRTIQIH